MTCIGLSGGGGKVTGLCFGADYGNIGSFPPIPNIVDDEVLAKLVQKRVPRNLFLEILHDTESPGPPLCQSTSHHSPKNGDGSKVHVKSVRNRVPKIKNVGVALDNMCYKTT